MSVYLIWIAFYNLLLLLISHFFKGLVPQVLVMVLFFSLDDLIHHIKSNLLSISHLVVSTGLHGLSLLLACICFPGSCTSNFQEAFMVFVGFLSSISFLYYICGNFNIHVDIPVGDSYKFMSSLVILNIQRVNLPVCTVTLWTLFYSPLIRIPKVVIVGYSFVFEAPNARFMRPPP